MRWLRYSLFVLIPGFMLGLTHATTLSTHGDGYVQQSSSTIASCQSQNNADDTDVVVIAQSKLHVRLPEFIASAPSASAFSKDYPIAQPRAPPQSLCSNFTN